MLQRAAAVRAQDAGGVRVVEAKDRAIVGGEYIAIGRRGRDLAGDREDAVAEDQRPLARLEVVAQLRGQVGGVEVAEGMERQPRGACAVPHAVVAGAIHEDPLVVAGQSLRQHRVAQVSRDVVSRGAGPPIGRGGRLDLPVERVLTVAAPRGGGPQAVLPQRSRSRIEQAGMVLQAQIAAPGEVVAPPPVDQRPRADRALHGIVHSAFPYPDKPEPPRRQARQDQEAPTFAIFASSRLNLCLLNRNSGRKPYPTNVRAAIKLSRRWGTACTSSSYTPLREREEWRMCQPPRLIATCVILGRAGASPKKSRSAGA